MFTVLVPAAVKAAATGGCQIINPPPLLLLCIFSQGPLSDVSCALLPVGHPSPVNVASQEVFVV